MGCFNHVEIVTHIQIRYRIKSKQFECLIGFVQGRFNRDVEIIVNGSEDPEPISELREELESIFPQIEKTIMKINVVEAVPIPEIKTDE